MCIPVAGAFVEVYLADTPSDEERTCRRIETFLKDIAARGAVASSRSPGSTEENEVALEDQYLQENATLERALYRLKGAIAAILSGFVPEYEQHPFTSIFLVPADDREQPAFRYFLDNEHCGFIQAVQSSTRAPKRNFLSPMRNIRFKPGEGISGRISQTKSPFYSPDWKADLQKDEFNYQKEFLDVEERFLKFDWLFSVPIISEGRILAVLQVGGNRHDGKDLSIGDRNRIIRVANMSSSTVKMAMELDVLRKQVARAETQSLATFLSHNIPSAFITPIRRELASVERKVRGLEERELAEDILGHAGRLDFFLTRLGTSVKLLDSSQHSTIVEHDVESINLHDLVNIEILPLVQYKLESKDLDQSTDIFSACVRIDQADLDPGLRVAANRIMLIQTMFQIVENAIDSLRPLDLQEDSERGAIRVSSTVDSGWAAIVISDQGRGISQRTLDALNRHLTAVADANRLFFPEDREQWRRSSHAGVGLHCAALYLSMLRVVPAGRETAGNTGRMVDEVIRGSIRLNSVEEQGTSVSMLIPVASRSSAYIRDEGDAAS